MMLLPPPLLLYGFCVLSFRFLQDKVNFGLNTDDSGVIGTTLSTECKVAIASFGLSREDVIQSMYSSARSSFLPDDEKRDLVDKLGILMEEYKAKYP